MQNNIKVDLLPNLYVSENGIFKKDEALTLSGKIAGVCYDKEGFKHLENEPIQKSMKRVDMTMNSGHHSVYDHINISFNLQNIPKILAMVLNNEKDYTTSEKSARYTPIVVSEGGIISEQEGVLYEKWNNILRIIIKQKYGNVFDDKKIEKLAQENARYFVTSFMPTQMIYTTSLRQINYIIAWMKKYIKFASKNDRFSYNLASSMFLFIDELERVGVDVPLLQKNEKERSLSLFGSNFDKKQEYFGDVYLTKYKGSFAELAQAHRHRTLNYQMQMLETKEYFIPPIIEGDKELVSEWLKDMKSVSHIYPQGMMVDICESGTYDNFILKCKERLCSAAQLEIMRQTRDTLLKYKNDLEQSSHPLKDDINNYIKGSRCTFPDYQCQKPCGFDEGIKLTRKI